MNYNNMEWLYDSRTECCSAMGTLPTDHYLKLVEEAHEKRGGITGQRDVLKTTTAKRIRDRMVSDIQKGAVLPPVVIGAVVDARTFKTLKKDEPVVTTFLAKISKVDLSIIDGMQRTAAIMEAAKDDKDVLSHPMRVEFWVAQNARSLIYRMLVLNTGQVPWTLGRQLAVVYTPLLEEIKGHVSNIERVFTPDKPGRRVGAGQFSADALVELYLAFSLRKTSVDTRESLSEEFSRLDFVDNLSDEAFQGYFYDALSSLVTLDLAFEHYANPAAGRMARGRDIFGSQPARIGFMVAVAQYVIGRPGLEREVAERATRIKQVVKQAQLLAARLKRMKEDELGQFLRLDVLSEILDKRVGQVGRYERSVFSEAFKVLIDERFDVPNMEPCWRAS